MGNTYVRRVTYEQTLSSGAGGVIASGNYAASQITSSGGWATVAAAFQRFRVRAMSVRMVPVSSVSFFDGTNARLNVGFAMCRYDGQVIPNTAGLILNSVGGRLAGSTDNIMLETSWKDNTNAKLFTTVGEAMAAEADFGIAFIGIGSTGVDNTVIFYVLQEWLVEFQGVSE